MGTFPVDRQLAPVRLKPLEDEALGAARKLTVHHPITDADGDLDDESAGGGGDADLQRIGAVDADRERGLRSILWI